MKKLKEMILHIAKTCENDPEFGATKLNKILFISDFFAYSVFEKSITGTDYFHLPKGPAPKLLKKAQEELILEDRANIEERPYFGRKQKRLVPKEDADISIFYEDELNLVKQVIKLLEGKNATQISDWSHDFLPWLLTEDREEIPYITTFTMFHVPTSKQGISWGENKLNELMESGHAS